jgi:hypothetical protein
VKILLLLALLLNINLGAGFAPAPITFEVTPTQQQAYGHVFYKIRIDKHPDNFLLCYGYDSGADAKYSCQPLNGANTPLLIQEEYLSLPAGDYEAFVELYRVPNRLVSKITHPFTVS